MGIINRLKNLRRGINVAFQLFVAPFDISKYGKLGRYSVVKSNSSLVSRNMFIDDWCVIQDRVNFISNKGKLIVKKYSVISSGCTIVPGAHRLTVGVPFYLATTNHFNDDEGDIIIEEDCWIGAGSFLLPKCHIGRGAVVGAGSVVKKDIPPYAVVVGVPAKIIAVKFTLEQILKHEMILYPPEDRMKKVILEKLFHEHYQGLRAIGSDELSKEDNMKLKSIRERKSIIDYSQYKNE